VDIYHCQILGQHRFRAKRDFSVKKMDLFKNLHNFGLKRSFSIILHVLRSYDRVFSYFRVSYFADVDLSDRFRKGSS